MPITSADIKLMQPERLTDNEDGGGQMTGNEVIDGDINNLFEDISRVNRTYGNVSLRKAFLKVDTPTSDLYLDAHSILSAQPADPKVTGLIFSTNDFYDERDQARQRIESFVIAGTLSGFYLRGNQLQGQRTIIIYAPVINAVRPPEVGDTFMLQTGTDLATQQFVKVLDVEHTEEVFTYGVEGDIVRTFRADQYVLHLSSELARNFPAGNPHPYPNNSTKVYTTQPSVSAKYYGTTTLSEAAEAGATSIRVAATFAPIIPTASSETPVIDQRPGGFLTQVVPSSADPITVDVTVAASSVSTLPTAAVPGSLSISVDGVAYTDKGAAFVNESGEPGALEGTTINYATGAIAWAGSAAGATTITYRPGTARQQLPNTGRIEIDETNRNFNYVLTLDPKPERTTLHASYMYLGKWYELRDDGTGNMVGDGSGQVNYDTGSVVLTLQAQPDANSVIFYRWTEGNLYQQQTEGLYELDTPVYLSLPNGRIHPGSVEISWLSGGVPQSATDSNGAITGDATGSINYATGRISLTSASTPDGNWTVEYDFRNTGALTAVTAVPADDTQANIELETAANIKPGSVDFVIQKSIKRLVKDVAPGFPVLSTNYLSQSHHLSDNGNGSIVDRRLNETVGTVNYSTGQIVISGASFFKTHNGLIEGMKVTNVAISGMYMSAGSGGGTATLHASAYDIETLVEEIRAQNVSVSYRLSAGTDDSGSASLTAAQSPWRFFLAELGPVVPGSVIMDIGGDLWFDDGEGNLVVDFNTTTGAGNVLGTIDYTTTQVQIEYYEGRPIVSTVTPIACLIGDDWSVITSTTFRTSAAPLRPNGFTVRANDVETDETYNGEADNQGTITGDDIVGEVDLQKGLATIEFPAPVFASSVFYNAVSYKQIPLDAAILGLDPVRLPADGRVPILRDADILVLTHTQRDLIDSPTDGLVIDAERDLLHDAWIEDSEGTRLDPEQYTLDKEAGTATLADPFTAQDADTNPLVGDLYFVHRVDDMALCTEARIDGTLQLAQPLYHALPADDTWVASAVYLGDLRARVKNWISYTTEPADYDSGGTETTAQYNQIAYPIAVDNRGSVQERWKIRFTSTTAFSLYGENRGLVATGSINADFSPTNPQTGTPYFTIVDDGWGTGWAVGNTVRFDTDAAAAPLWLVRTVLPGQATVNDDQLKIELRGDHN